MLNQLPMHQRRKRRTFRPLVLGPIACASLLLATPLLAASDLPGAYTLDLPTEANLATPVWLGHPEMPPRAFATLDVPISPPAPDASLLVTVYFQEKEGGFLRVGWQKEEGAVMLSDNFYEGIGMSNQRSLLISPSTMQGDGTLHFQCGDTSLGIARIRFEWLENHAGLASPLLKDLLVTPATGSTQLASTLNGQPAPAGEAAWHERVVAVPMIDLPERVEQGVEFAVQIDIAPARVRLELKEAGLPWGQHLVIWVNQKRAGTITPAVPDLLDDGFLPSANGSANYVGWRDGSFYVPAGLLKVGDNAIQFSTEGDTQPLAGSASDVSTGSLAPLAIKDVVLQLKYLPQPVLPDASTASAPASEPSSDSSGPTTVDAAASTEADSSLPSPLVTPPTISNP